MVFLLCYERFCDLYRLRILKFIFNLRFCQQQFPTLWKQTAAVFKKRDSSDSINNYRPMSVLNKFSKVFEFIIPGHFSYCFQCKLNFCQLVFTLFKSAVTNLVTSLDFVTPLVFSQCQFDVIYFYLGIAFDPVLHKLVDCVLSAGYVIWFHS
jgi:hypothetical protein